MAHLTRAIGLPHATAIVVGIIIGASVFVQSSEITARVPSLTGVTLAWVVAGLLTMAGALGAEIAASRPICDNEWLPMDRQIGSSGQTVAPKLYVALGISGAIQHLVGMKGARTIVAINKDAEAPIFEVADYGIQGDIFELAPALIAELEKS